MTALYSSAQDQLLTRLQKQLSKHRKQVMSYRLLQSLPLVMLTLVLTYALSQSLLYSSISAALIYGIILWRLSRSTELAAIHLDNYLLHLNRLYPELEESAQLINRNKQELHLLQQLQQDKVSTLLSSILDQQHQKPVKDYALSYPLFLNIASAVGLLAAFLLINNVSLPQWRNSAQSSDSYAIEQPTILVDGINLIQVSVVPPAYSQLPIRQLDELDITLLAGSQVTWLLGFKQTDNTSPEASANHTIQLSSGEELALLADDSGRFTASASITQSVIYTISSASGKLDGVHTLSVTPDNVPQIRFLLPISTTTEIARDAQAQLNTEVVVSDDFAVSKVSIQASIAKGSGEGVKFRDQNFEFDRMEIIAGKAHYFKHWQLTELGMEPGDEMYFSVLAWDNREPQAQLSRSPSKIVRWLEEQQSELATDGILFDVMPEYFKSQRQIIIETEQLLVDEAQLTLAEFKRTSTELGFAQSDLKQKYGQYVGDEFEGATLHNMESGPAHQTEKGADDTHADHEDGENKEHVAATEQHEHQAAPQLNQDKSGASDLIAQYGHNHGEAELGFVGFKGQASPTALMKQAIANMWNAELHLMMSEPALALPYEKEALKFLTQAKNAERIYVKRLGFEPPPVSESRRYQGELNNIKNAKQNQQSIIPFAQQQLLSDSINALQLWLNAQSNEVMLGLSTEQYNALKVLLTAGLQSTPDNIQHIATLEKLNLDARQLKQDCASCISQLQQTLWRLLPPLIAAPLPQQAGYLLSNPAISDYQQFLQQEQQP